MTSRTRLSRKGAGHETMVGVQERSQTFCTTILHNAPCMRLALSDYVMTSVSEHLRQ